MALEPSKMKRLETDLPTAEQLIQKRKFTEPSFFGPENDGIRPEKGAYNYTNADSSSVDVPLYTLKSPDQVSDASQKLQIDRQKDLLRKDGYCIFSFKNTQGITEFAAVHESQLSYIRSDRENFPDFREEKARPAYPSKLPRRLGGEAFAHDHSTKRTHRVHQNLSPRHMKRAELARQAEKIKGFLEIFSNNEQPVSLRSTIDLLPREQRTGLNRPTAFLRVHDYERIKDRLDITGYSILPIDRVERDGSHIHRVYFVKDEAPSIQEAYRPSVEDTAQLEGALGVPATPSKEAQKTPISKITKPFKFLAHLSESGNEIIILRDGTFISEKYFQEHKRKLENDLPAETEAYRTDKIRYFYDPGKTYSLRGDTSLTYLREVLMSAPVDKEGQHYLPIEDWLLMKQVLSHAVVNEIESNVRIDSKEGKITFYDLDQSERRNQLKDGFL